MIRIIFFFFFSSRRRHTRWNCDWSSDVCSSDLGRAAAEEDVLAGVDDQAVPAERAGRAAEPGPGLEQGYVRAPLGQRDRRGDPGQPSPDDGDLRVHPNLPARALTATMAFSPVDSDMRLCSTAAGRAAIRSSSW